MRRAKLAAILSVAVLTVSAVCGAEHAKALAAGVRFPPLSTDIPWQSGREGYNGQTSVRTEPFHG